MYTTLLQELQDGLLTITINRPDKLNALNRQVMNELEDVIQSVYRQETIKAVILTGTGNKAFVAGADITEFLGLDNEQGVAVARHGQALFSKIENCPKPVVAAVNGFALGGGCELAMACHMRLCSDHAVFGQPEISLGLIPGYGGTQRLTQLIGKAKALELMLTGDHLNAQKALELGLVNHITSPEALLPATRELLQKIIHKSSTAVAGIIACANAAVTNDGENGYIKEIEAFGACFASEDMKEGVHAFLEKRTPVFKGK